MFLSPAIAFGFAGLVYGLVLAVGSGLLLSIILIASLRQTTAKPRDVVKAAYCYLLQAVGIFLLTAGALPAVYGVLARVEYDSRIYIALLLLFTAGGLTFLWHDTLVRDIDESSRAVPAAIFWFTVKFVGFVSALVSILSLLTSMLLTPTPLTDTWWVMPVLFLLYGLVLSWATREEQHAGRFESILLNEPPTKIKSPLAFRETVKKPGVKKGKKLMKTLAH